MMSTLTPNGDEHVIADFMQQFEAAEDGKAIVRQFAGLHPHLGLAFADFAAAKSVLKDAGPSVEVDSILLRPGQMLGEFKVVRFVKHGGMGEIYEAEQISLKKRRVALKVIRHGRAVPEAQARFRREQDVLAKLHQTNIVPVFAAGTQGEVQYFAMQYIDGATLGEVVKLLRTRDSRPAATGHTSSLAKLVEKASGPQSDPTAPTAANTPTVSDPTGSPANPVLTDEYMRSVAASLADVADALDAAHKAGVLHRDVKPSNLMAEKSGKCWVIDFGLAGLVGETHVGQVSNLSANAGDPSLTATGSVLGTYAYMAPEQIGGRPTDLRSDVWSLGATLYELLALDRPFPGPTHDDYRQQLEEAKPKDLRKLSRAVPADLAAISRKAMRKEPGERYQSAGDFAADLRHWLNLEPTMANPPWAPRRIAMWARRQPGWAAMVGVACAAVIGVTGLLLEREERKKAILIAEVQAADAREETVAKELELTTAASAERDNLHARQLKMIAFEHGRLPPHTAGWRDRLWQMVTALAAGGTDPGLRDSMASLLEGLDALTVPNFDEGAARSLLFDATGNRLLMGGFHDKARWKDLNQPTRVRDVKTRAIKPSTQEFDGPIGWRGTVPVQLVLTDKERPTLQAWDVDRNASLEEFTLPDQHRPINSSLQTGLSVIRRFFGLPVFAFPSLVDLEMSNDATHVSAIVRAPSGTLTILIWQSGTPTPIATIPLSTEQQGFVPHQMSLSPDGSLLALGSEDGRVAIWSLAGGPKPIKTLDIGRSRMTALTFARHRWMVEAERLDPKGVPGWLLATGNSSGQIAVWDLGRLKQIMQSNDSHHEVFAMAFSRDAVTLNSAGRDVGRCWDLRSGRQLLTTPYYHGTEVVGLAVSPTNDRLAHCSIPVFGKAGGVDLFELESGRGIQALRGLTGQPSRVTITRDGERAAGLTQDWQLGVWDCESGELLMAVDAPLAMYADMDDVRLTDDGRFLIVAGGKEAQRWEIPARRGDSPRKVDSWKLNPAWTNRLAITPDGKLLVCRHETKSGERAPNAVHPRQDPHCVRIYELEPGKKEATKIAQHDEHAWHVFQIHAVPDGSLFISDGITDGDKRSNTIVAYAGQIQRVRWTISDPDSRNPGSSEMDSSGSVLKYRLESGIAASRAIPSGTPVDALPEIDKPGLAGKFVFKQIPGRKTGLHLGSAEANNHVLTLSPDEPVDLPLSSPFTPDGQFLIWGGRDGTFHVADLPRVRDQLKTAGFPGW